MAAPEATDLDKESDATKTLYAMAMNRPITLGACACRLDDSRNEGFGLYR